MHISDFKNQEPKLSLETFFSGKTWAWGMFEDRFGKLRRSFQVNIDGQINDGVLTLNEDFFYDDGERSNRVWEITKTSQNTYSGKAEDIVDQAHGVIEGNALNWRYSMDLPVGKRTWRVQFNDWMFLRPGQVMLNKACVKKWGLHIGTVTLFFSKAKPE